MATEIRTQTAGNMWKILVKPGDIVKEGDYVFIMEVMKMEVEHVAPHDGVIKAVHASEGQEGLDADMLIIEME